MEGLGEEARRAAGKFKICVKGINPTPRQQKEL